MIKENVLYRLIKATPEYERRKKEIELHFENILKDTTIQQRKDFYFKIIGWLIPSVLGVNGIYNYLGFEFVIEDKLVLAELLEEYNTQLDVIMRLK